jgi:hypothetical protein
MNPFYDTVPTYCCVIIVVLNLTIFVINNAASRFLKSCVVFGFGSKHFFSDSDTDSDFYTSGKGNINFLKYRQSVFHEDVLPVIKLKFLPA